MVQHGLCVPYRYPLDLIRARIAAHWSKTPMYESFIDGARTIVRTEGIASLYSGMPLLINVEPRPCITTDKWLEGVRGLNLHL